MLPRIRQYAHVAFRHLREEAREEAIAETIANSLVAYVRLFEQGRIDLAYPTVLARFAVAQIQDGRRVGNRLNTKEVLAERAQERHGFVVERLDRFDKYSGEWIEATIEDTHTPVPDQAAFRCDFPAWLATQSPRNRKIAEALAVGHSTSEVARRFNISPGRVSQLRRELHDSWSEFHTKKTTDEPDAVPASRGRGRNTDRGR
jgi:hypothetical protein